MVRKEGSGLKALVLTSICFALPVFADVKLTRSGDRIDIAIDGKPFSTFHMGTEGNKPYLWPLITADGKAITRRWPMEDIKTDSHDHKHQRGLWFSHGDVNGTDFWGNDPSYNTPNRGKIVLDKVVSVKSGEKSGSLEATFNWVDKDGKTVLTEDRKMTFYDDPKNRIIDVDITLKAVEKAVFGDTKEGTFAIRLADSMTEKAKGGQMVNAKGGAGMKAVWGKPSPWVDYSGTINGEKVGVAIFDNPANPKHPTYWHSRDYGLFAANIFGEHDFFNDKARNGSVTLEPGKTMRFQYRVVIHPGDAQAANIADLYQQWAHK
jgi:Methane oxygenase PmoA